MTDEPVSYIYIVQADRQVKIGYSRDPMKRLSEIQVGTPVHCFIAAQFEVFAEEVLACERLLHDFFSGYRLRGEWFEMRGRAAKEGATRIFDWALTNEGVGPAPDLSDIDFSPQASQWRSRLSHQPSTPPSM